MKEITVDATVDNLDTVHDFVDEELKKYGCSTDVRLKIDLSIEELFVNIASYAYQDKIGKATIKIDISDGDLTAKIIFIDSGVPYDPLKKEDPDVTLSAEERSIGGLGIYLVKKNMDDIEYKYEDGKNILSIKKKIKG